MKWKFKILWNNPFHANLKMYVNFVRKTFKIIRHSALFASLLFMENLKPASFFATFQRSCSPWNNRGGSWRRFLLFSYQLNNCGLLGFVTFVTYFLIMAQWVIWKCCSCCLSLFFILRKIGSCWNFNTLLGKVTISPVVYITKKRFPAELYRDKKTQ